MNKKLKIFTDGGARGNPGPAGCGVVMFDEQDKQVGVYKKYLGETTNNIAEYNGVILAMEEAKKIGVEELDFYLDSELVVKQLKREYKVKNSELAKLFVKIFNMQQDFKQVNYNHIPREMNKLADKLANEAMDEGMN